MKLDLHRFDDEHQARLLDFLVGDPETAKHFDPSAFEVIQVLRVMHPALAVDLAVSNAKGSDMFRRCRWGL